MKTRFVKSADQQAAAAAAVKLKRVARQQGRIRTAGRHHPTGSEINYAECELEFMFAIQEWKRLSGRQFPTLCEILQVLVGLGYEKAA